MRSCCSPFAVACKTRHALRVLWRRVIRALVLLFSAFSMAQTWWMWKRDTKRYDAILGGIRDTNFTVENWACNKTFACHGHESTCKI